MEFTYKAKNRAGTESSGKLTASSEKQASEMLSKQDLFVISLKNSGGFFGGGMTFKKKVSLKDKIIFTKQLAIMIKGGLPLVEALDALREQTENQEFIKAISMIIDDVRGGQSLSKSLAKHPKLFSDLYVAVTYSGERSGKLDDVLDRLAEQLQKDYDLITSVKGAMTYPIVIVSALVGVMILMLVFVVPKMKSIFDDMGVKLPLATRVLLNMSGFLVKDWYIVLGVGAVLFFGIRFWARTPKGGMTIDKMKIRVPIFGSLVNKIYLARFTRTTATLIASGLPMLEIIETDKIVIGNKYFRPIFDQISKDVEGGVPLSLAMKKHKVFPVMIAQMVSVGEKSGKIDEILLKLADFYDKEVEAMTSNMAALIEPILIVVIGAGVGAAIVAVIMPIYSLVNVI